MPTTIVEREVVTLKSAHSTQPKPRTIRSILKAALRVIEKRGWTTGELQTENGEVCLVGAVRLAASGNLRGNHESTLALKVIRRHLPRDNYNNMYRSPMNFNDAHERSDVVAVINAAIKDKESNQPV
jgi:hypothetical protein